MMQWSGMAKEVGLLLFGSEWRGLQVAGCIEEERLVQVRAVPGHRHGAARARGDLGWPWGRSKCWCRNRHIHWSRRRGL